MRLTSVDLPEPEGPVMATHSPATMVNAAWSSARTAPAWPAYSRVTELREMTAQSGGCCGRWGRFYFSGIVFS